MTENANPQPERRPLLEWLLRKYPDTPKTRAKQWILAGRVRLDGVLMRRPQEVIPDPGPALELRDRQAVALDCGTGWPIHPRVTLLFLDSALAVVDKGPGLLSVPGPGGELSALSILADFLVGKLKPRELAGRTMPTHYRRLVPLPVHRLDQYTTGLLCLAMNPVAREHLLAQVRSHAMLREYVAFVQGRPPTPRGVWRHWLELSQDETRQEVRPGTLPPANPRGKVQEAITHYEVLGEFPLGKTVVSKLGLRLETGCRHQIRVQAAYVGLPVLGDRLYHPDYRLPNNPRALIPFSRQALHSTKLTLRHPLRQDEDLSWTAGLPKDLRVLEAELRSARGRFQNNPNL